MKSSRQIKLFIFLCLIFFACKPVKPWQRIYVNDPEMQLGSTNGELQEQNVETYREGAGGSPGGKSGGGCGCN